MSDNDKNTCPVCFTKMRNIKRVLTCPECGYKYCDRGRESHDLFDTTHTHAPTYTTYTKDTSYTKDTTYTKGTSYTSNTSNYQNTNRSSGTTSSGTRNSTTTNTSSGNNTTTGSTRQAGNPAAKKVVKIIVIVYILMMFGPLICGVFGSIFTGLLEAFVNNEYEDMHIEISSDLDEDVTTSIDVDSIIENLDLEGLEVTIPEVPEIPEMPETFEVPEIDISSEETPAINDTHADSYLLKTIFNVDYSEHVSKSDLGKVTSLKIVTDENGSFMVCYNDNNYIVCEPKFQLDEILYFYNLESLTIEDNGTWFWDYSFLNDSDMPSLKQLSLTTFFVEDIDFLNNMPMMEQLTLINTDAKDLTPLTTASNSLQMLTLRGNIYIDDYSVIGELTNLHYLDLADSFVYDIEFATSLTNLTKLNLENTYIRSLAPVKDCPYLSWINVTGVQFIDDYAGLKKYCVE